MEVVSKTFRDRVAGSDGLEAGIASASCVNGFWLRRNALSTQVVWLDTIGRIMVVLPVPFLWKE